MAQIDVPSFEQIATMLSQLATNYSNLFIDYYNLFYNPTPMDITVELYDDDGNLSTITIPNRAKDRAYILNGNGDPEGVVSAQRGSTYQDLTNGIVYVKQFDTSDSNGWRKLMTSDSLKEYIIQDSGDPEGSQTAPKGVLYIDRGTASLYIKTTETGNTGWYMISANTATLANIDLTNLSVIGEAHFANPSLSNLSNAGTALLASKENISNKADTWTNKTDNTHYPTTKLVSDALESQTAPLANRDLSNLTTTGEEHFVRTMTQVRDCIFKAPNGLPSATDNVINLPQGTIVLCANGVDSNKAVVNKRVTLENSASVLINWSKADEGVVFYDDNNPGTLRYISTSNYLRQVTEPQGSTSVIWYNPDTNVYQYGSVGSWTSFRATEIGNFTTASDGTVNSFIPRHPLVVATMDDIKEQNRIVRNIGEIVQSTIPLTDAGLHLLDGTLLSGSGSYGDFVTYISGLYTASPTADYFTTEADWQTAVSTYGVCGKFVYDSVNNTVRLPKYNSKIYTGGGIAPVIGNGNTLGLSNGVSDFGMVLPSSTVRLTVSNTMGTLGTSATIASTGDTTNVLYGVTTNPTKSGIIADLANITTSLDGYYYIVVATSTKTNIQVDIDEIVTDLNGKMDIDMSNMSASQSAKNTIVGWGMPDYANRSSRSWATSYSEDTDGYVYMQTANIDDRGYHTLTITQNGVSTEFDSRGSTTASESFRYNLFIPVPKGATWIINGDSYGVTLYWIPCAGGN